MRMLLCALLHLLWLSIQAALELQRGTQNQLQFEMLPSSRIFILQVSFVKIHLR